MPLQKKALGPKLLTLFVLTLILYILTLHRGLAPLDSSEFLTVIRIHGAAHPPGYPLLTLLGIFFSYIPIGDIFFRIHFVSAFFGALTVVLVEMVCREITDDEWASFIAAAMLATSLFFWPRAVEIEVFTLHCALSAGALLLALKYGRLNNSAFVYGMAFLAGLAFCHLHTFVLFLPSLFILVWSNRKRHFKFLPVLSAFILGCVPYLYLPWAATHHPFYNSGDPSTLPKLINVILRRSYGTFSLSALAGGSPLQSLAQHMVSFTRDFGLDSYFLGLGFAVFGFIFLFKKNRTVALALLLALILGLPVFFLLANAPSTPLFTQVIGKQLGIPLIVMVIFASQGLALFFEKTRHQPLLAWLSKGLLVLLPLIMAFNHYEISDRSREQTASKFGNLILNSVDPGAVIFSCYDTLNFVLHELTDAEGLRPDVTVVNFNPAAFETYLTGPTHPIYFTFAGLCDSRDLLGGLRAHLIPQGVVYRYYADPTKEDWLAASQKGQGLLQTWPEIRSQKVSDHPWNAGEQELISWISDAYYNMAVTFRKIGDQTDAASYNDIGSEMLK